MRRKIQIDSGSKFRSKVPIQTYKKRQKKTTNRNQGKKRGMKTNVK